MSPWSNARNSSNSEKRSEVRLGWPDASLGGAIVILAALAAAILWMNRYEIGQAGGLPVRLNRMTGQVIACVPKQGCFMMIPAGEPELGTVREVSPPQGSTSTAQPAGPAGASPSTTPSQAKHEAQKSPQPTPPPTQPSKPSTGPAASR